MSTSFGTLSRPQAGNSAADQRTKIKAIGAFTNMYLITREANIVDEELNYLEQVYRFPYSLMLLLHVV